MSDFLTARVAMIESQLRPAGVTEPLLLRAFMDLPREEFVAPHRRTVAYVDDLQPVGRQGRFILSPVHFGRMAQFAKVGPRDRVLDLGAASGFSTAVLARLAGEVLGVEFDPELALRASDMLAALGAANARIVTGDLGVLAGESFDAILVEGALDEDPTDLVAMLRPNGRLVVPVLKRGVAVVQVYVREPEGVMFTSEFDATMPRLWNWAPKEEFVF